MSERFAVVVAGEDDLGAACAAALEARGMRVALVETDLDRPEAAARAVADAAADRESVSALVNCHFWVRPATSVDVSLEEWERSLRVNLTGPLLTTRALLAKLEAAGGASVVHLGSVDGQFGNPNVAAYSAAKAGLVALTHVQAHELAPRRIRVNCVARALVESAAMADLPADVLGPITAATPLGRAARPSEVAAAVAFLASDDASYVTGTVLTVDGGRTGITRGTA